MGRMDQPPETSDLRRKRLLWRASHRGIREMDLLFGGFARQRLADMNGAELAEFEELVELSDQDMLSWVTGEAPVPQRFDTLLVREFLRFRP